MTTAPRSGVPVRLSESIERACELLCAVSLFTMMVLTFVDVLGRYIFSFPIYGSFEIVGILLALIVFSGLCIAVRRDDHITVDLFDPGIGIGGTLLRYSIQLASVVALGVILYVLAHETISDFDKGVRMVILDMNRGMATAAMTALVGLAFLLQLALLVFGTLEGGPRDSAEGES